MSTENHELRHLKHQLKRVNKTMGTQGQTIHLLRAELAEVRTLHSKIERGDLRRLERQVPELVGHNQQLLSQVTELTERLREAEANAIDPSRITVTTL